MASTITADNGVSSGSAGIKTSADSTGVLALQTTTAGGTATTAVTIDTSQNVGIGTSSPSDSQSFGKAVDFRGTTGSAYYSGTTDATTRAYFATYTGGAYLGTETNHPQIFRTNNTERARIDTSGNLLVGTTTAGIGKLTVSGGITSTAYPQFNIYSTNSSTAFEWVMRTGTEMQFYVSNASVLARLTSSGVWTDASDARYKENIRPVTYGLAEVMQLQPRAYNIIGSEKQEIGFVAQEVETILPELVESSMNSVTEEERLTLSYGQMSAVLVKAIQEQQALITTLTERITALEGAQA